jgi:hypothetical protein
MSTTLQHYANVEYISFPGSGVTVKTRHTHRRTQGIPRFPNASYALLVLIPLLLFSQVAPVAASSHKASSNDDLFGYNFSPDRLPTNTQGLQGTYSISTTGITLSCSQGGWIGVVDTARISGGSPYEWLLQGFVGLGCNGSTEQWSIFAAWFDNNNNYHTSQLTWLSISTYTSLSGTISIYYTGSTWTLAIYVSQTGSTYTYSFGSAGGSYMDPANNDWTSVETDYQQVGLTFSSSFLWYAKTPKFLVSGAWQNWNLGNSTWHALDMYAVYQPAKSGNTLGVQPLSSPGVEVYVGTSVSDGSDLYWCVYGNCPKTPST